MLDLQNCQSFDELLEAQTLHEQELRSKPDSEEYLLSELQAIARQAETKLAPIVEQSHYIAEQAQYELAHQRATMTRETRDALDGMNEFDFIADMVARADNTVASIQNTEFLMAA